MIIVSTHIVKQHFNPLPRKEGDPEEFDWADFYGSISIHSLVKRETPASRPPNQSKTHFNPLPRKEGDLHFQILRQSHQEISIHSLVKRETHLYPLRTL